MSKASGLIKKGLALRRLAQAIEPIRPSTSKNLRLTTFKALKILRCSRPAIINVLDLVWRLGWRLQPKNPKLALWMAVAHPNAKAKSRTLERIKLALNETEAWRKANFQLIGSRWNHRGRLNQPKKLLNQLGVLTIDRVFFWHHYDARGYLPRTWLATLEELRQRGWVVIASSSTLTTTAQQELVDRDIIISQRLNQGRCLGAYRDFCLLFTEEPNLIDRCNQLVLSNDSYLPIGGARKFADCINEISERLQTKNPILAGLTDSVERDFYHIQSYLIGVNSPLIRNPSWLQFWQQLDLLGSKDDLINQGEIGLSQAMINAGVKTWARYSLIHMLLDQPETGAELERFAMREPNGVNLTLFAWQSLLKAGYPMIKKQVIYSLQGYQGLPIPLSQLLPWLTDHDAELRNDLEEILRSRFSTKDMDWLKRLLKLNHSKH